MRTRFFLYPFLWAVLTSSIAFAAKPTPAPKAAATATPVPTVSKPVVDQTAQTIIYCYHRLVDKVRYPGTEITPAAFEAQMKELKDRGITVISLQDLLAWKRGEKNIPPRCAVITFDDGWKSQYEQWVQNEVVGCKQLLEQRLGIKINCFAVPFGTYNEHVKEIARNAGYEAMFTVYGQPITYTSPMDALGRYAMEANKPKVFEDAVKMIATTSGGPGAPAVAAVGPANLSTEPADGTTVRTALPLIKANLSAVGQIDPASVQLRISGLGLVPASFDPKTGVVSYQVTQKLREKNCTVIMTAKSGDKKVETHWTFFSRNFCV